MKIESIKLTKDFTCGIEFDDGGLQFQRYNLQDFLSYLEKVIKREFNERSDVIQGHLSGRILVEKEEAVCFYGYPKEKAALDSCYHYQMKHFPDGSMRLDPVL